MIEALKPVTRWTHPRKAEVVWWAIARGLISIEQACAAHRLSAEEVASWGRLSRRHGAHALCVTKAQKYRETTPRTKPEAPIRSFDRCQDISNLASHHG